MPSHSPTQRKHLLQPLYDLKGYLQEIFLSTITKFIRLTNRFSDPDNLDQSGVIKCYLCSGPLALLVSPSLSSLHLAAPSLNLPSFLPSYLSPEAGARQLFVVAILS